MFALLLVQATISCLAFSADVVKAIVESFRRTLSDYAFCHGGKTIDIGCTIGVSNINSTTISRGEALSQADLACHLDKRNERNRVQIFTEQEDGDVRTMSIDMVWSRYIKLAIEHDRYILAVQPINHSASQTVS